MIFRAIFTAVCLSILTVFGLPAVMALIGIFALFTGH